MGTVAYLSPEQVTTVSPTPRSDVYAAGILLYEMLTGRKPYDGDTPDPGRLPARPRRRAAAVAVVPGLPAELDHLVARATNRDPDQRPADARGVPRRGGCGAPGDVRRRARQRRGCPGGSARGGSRRAQASPTTRWSSTSTPALRQPGRRGDTARWAHRRPEAGPPVPADARRACWSSSRAGPGALGRGLVRRRRPAEQDHAPRVCSARPRPQAAAIADQDGLTRRR